jgi:DNA-binding transcriptional LysR family regulator
MLPENGSLAMADEINELRLLTQVVAAGSLTAAALHLNSSLPAISRRLAALEDRLGVRLIDRHARRFHLTDEGAVLHERALQILSDIDDAEAEVSEKRSTPRGFFKLCSPVHIGRQTIAPIIAEFTRLYPRVGVELILSDAVVDVAEDEIDLVIYVGTPTQQSVVARRLVPSRRVVLASPEYLKRKGTPQIPDDLLEHECIRLMRGRKLFDRWLFREDGVNREIRVRGRLMTTSSEVTYQWICNGYGIGIKGLWDVHKDLEAGKLVEVLPDYACDNVDLYLAYASKRHLPLRLRVFIDFLIENLAAIYPLTKE